MFARGVVQPGTGSSEVVTREVLARVIEEHVQSGAAAPWDGKTSCGPPILMMQVLLAPAC